MAKNYIDFIDAMAQARRDGHTIDRVVVTKESLDEFMSDGEYTNGTEAKRKAVGEFSISIEVGDGNYIISDSGEKFYL